MKETLNVSQPDLGKITLLKEYFEREREVSTVFLFGSQAKNLVRIISDWDIGVYFKPKEYLELETESDNPRGTTQPSHGLTSFTALAIIASAND